MVVQNSGRLKMKKSLGVGVAKPTMYTIDEILGNNNNLTHKDSNHQHSRDDERGKKSIIIIELFYSLLEYNYSTYLLI